MPATADLSDGDLARTVVEGGPDETESAESELYRRFAPRVRLYGLRHLRSEDAAADLVQRVMLLTIQKLRSGSVRDVDRIASFVLGTSRMMTIDLRRGERRRERLREAFMPPSVFETPADDTQFDVDRLESCVATLAERERMVVLLTFYAERTASEVGQQMGVTEGNVRVIRHRAIQRLRACLISGEVVS